MKKNEKKYVYTYRGSRARTHNTLTNLHYRNTTAKHQSITMTQTAHRYRNNIQTSSTTIQFTAVFLNQNMLSADSNLNILSQKDLSPWTN